MAEEDQDENQDQDSAAEQISFSLSISLDRESFFRRACPSCGLDFKTEGNPADFAWALELQLRRVSEEVNVDPATVAEETPKETLRCPYCQHVAESSEMHTAETVSYLRRFALREYALPKLHKMLAEFSESITRIGSRGGGGIFSISISSNYEHPLLPPRPIYGPDAPDMMIVHFLCCGKKIKISEGWRDMSLCTYCGTQVSLV